MKPAQSRLAAAACAAVAAGAGATGTPVAMVAATVAGATALVQTIDASPARADNLWLKSCAGFKNKAPAWGRVQQGSAWSLSNECGAGRSLEILTIKNAVAHGHLAGWYTTAPQGVGIDWAQTWNGTPVIACDLASRGYTAFWQTTNFTKPITYSGYCNQSTDIGLGSGINRSIPTTSKFGFYVWCVNSHGCTGNHSLLGVYALTLGATETGSPSLLALGSNNLFYEGGRWVRSGPWPISLQAADVTGVCNMRAWVNGAIVQGPVVAPDESVWDQCDDTASYDGEPQSWQGGTATVNTASYPTGGPLTVAFQAENSAGSWSTSRTATTYVDNDPVDLTLTGPTSAPTTAGTQYLTAIATAGPSGVAGVYCSVDGSAWSSEPLYGAGSRQAAAAVPVSGLGSHTATCYAINRAVDPTGAPARSPLRSWAIRIGEPVNAGLSLARVTRRCRRVASRPGHRDKRHRGHARRRLVCSTPSVFKSVERVRFGHGVTVFGWLATADGAPLSHVPVSIMTAPDNGSVAWRRAKAVRTAANGSWSARLGAGPSWLIEAVYGGGSRTQPATSAPVRTVVPAKVRITVHPTHVLWGQRIVVSGRVVGGHVPDNSQVLQLRVGIGNIGSVQGNPSIDSRTGRFRFIWQFRPGHGALNVWFAVGTLKEADMPWAPGVSRRMIVELR